MKAKPGKLSRFYGYGIVDRFGAPWWSEDCVCQDEGPLQGIVEGLNEDDPAILSDARRPYRVVTLRFEEAMK